MKVALDTNVLAYAEGTNGIEKKDAALHVIQTLPAGAIVVPVQALGELFNVLVLKAKRAAADARAAILSWGDTYEVVDTSSAVMLNATDLASDYNLRIWDAVVLSASAEAGCRLLLSEDLQEGFTWRGVTVTNPFAQTRHVLLRALLDETEPNGNQSSEE
jgi:predicted nucleic acid-binding protein